MYLLAGLGNPGTQYEKTPHNIGFITVESIVKKYAPDATFSFSKKHNAKTAQITVNGIKVLCALPQTFMNLSGKSIQSLCQYYDIDPNKNLIVVHDEIDLPSGKSKADYNRGSAGHNGIKSIIQELGTKEFHRIRIGVKFEEYAQIPTENYVLKSLPLSDWKVLDSGIEQAIQQIEDLIK